MKAIIIKYEMKMLFVAILLGEEVVVVERRRRRERKWRKWERA